MKNILDISSTFLVSKLDKSSEARLYVSINIFDILVTFSVLKFEKIRLTRSPVLKNISLILVTFLGLKLERFNEVKLLGGGGVTGVLGLLHLGDEFGVGQAVARRTGVLLDGLGLVKGGEGTRHLRAGEGRGVIRDGDVLGCELGGGGSPRECAADEHENACHERKETGEPG